jgi:hypothetical protein
VRWLIVLFVAASGGRYRVTKRVACAVGRTCPAARFRAQGEVLPRGAAGRGEIGDGAETVVSAEFRVRRG